MSLSRILVSALGVCAAFLLTTWDADTTARGAGKAGRGIPSPVKGCRTRRRRSPRTGASCPRDGSGARQPASTSIRKTATSGATSAAARARPAAGPSIAKTTRSIPVFKFDRHTGKVLANIGKGVMVTPHGIHVDRDGNVWIADFAGNKEGTKGHQVHKFNQKGEKLLSLGIAGKPGNADGQFNQPNDVVVGPDGSIYVSDGHDAQGMTTNQRSPKASSAARPRASASSRADGKFIKSWGTIGVKHGEFRTPHALMFDAKGRLWVADRGNHRLEIFDQEGKYLESRYMFGRISGFFIKGNLLYAIDSESGPLNHPNWRDGVRIGPIDEDRVTAFIPPFEREDRVYQGTAGEGIAVDADGNVYAAEGPNSLVQAGGAFTKYSVK